VSAQPCAPILNVRFREINVDDVSCKDALVTSKPSYRDGHVCNSGTGWGIKLNEEVLEARPRTSLLRLDRRLTEILFPLGGRSR